MGNKTTMWLERTHKIRRIPPLGSKRVLCPVFLSPLSLSLLPAISISVPAAATLHLYSLRLALSWSPKEPALPADRPRGWHCGSPNGSRPQTDMRSTATFVFARLYRRCKSMYEMHRTSIETWSIRPKTLSSW